MKRFSLLAAGLSVGLSLAAQVPIVQPDLDMKTGIAPAFFGPNAFQVPEMLDGTTQDSFGVELSGDFYSGYAVKGAKDLTGDIFLKLRLPLFTDRVNLTAWMPMREWYSMDRSVMDYRRIAPSVSGNGSELGPAFLTLDILLLREGKWYPSLAFRAALRTATEDKAFASARSYDSAGYFFDLSAGKSFGPFRLALSAGFLCWQTDNGRQNDAIMFGVLGTYTHEYFKLAVQYGGYVGWEKYGDFPRTLRARADFGSGRWPVRPFFQYQHGFNDWPFDQYRLGLSLDFFIKKGKWSLP